MTQNSKKSNPYVQIFNEVEDLIYILDKNGDVLIVNQALINRLGYTYEQLIGMNIMELHPPEYKEDVTLTVERLAEVDELRCMIPLVTSTGETVTVESRIFNSEYNGIPAYYGICKDMTALRKWESELLNKKAQLTAMLDNLPFYAWMKDSEGHLIEVNKNFEKLCGKSTEEIIGMTDFDIWPEVIARKYRKEDSYVIQSGKQLSVEEFIITGENLEWVETHKTPIRDQYGKTTGVTGFSRNITEERELQQELNEQKRFLKAMIDAIPDLIFYKDPHSVYLGCNTAFSKNFVGLSEEEIVGKTDFDFIKDQDLAAFFKQKDEAMLAAGVPVSNEETITLANGTVVDIETMKTPFFNEEGNVAGLIGVSRDITARKHVERELLLARQSAEAANVMKGQFLANMSHEIRTPMNGILGFLDLLKSTPLTEVQKNYLHEAWSASEILLYVINDILDFSKIEAGRMILENRAFNLKEVIENAVMLMAPKRSNAPLLELHLADNLPKAVVGDPSRLKQIIINLMSNAVKFTENGLITFSSERINEEEDLAVIHFTVTDTGIGIKEEDIGSLFAAFTQADASTSRRYGGSGLGLTITRELTMLMGGDVWAESTYGSGTTFHVVVRFPEADEIVSDSETTVSNLWLADSYKRDSVGSSRILLAEDNDINTKLIAVLLESKGLEYDIATDGFDVVSAFKNKHYDLIFMDCQMPGMDGYEATRMIREVENGDKRTTIIAMTANAMVGDREKCLIAGMDDYISKPISKVNFYGILDKYLLNDEGSIAVSPATTHNIPKKQDSFSSSVEKLIEDMGIDYEDAVELINGYLKKLPKLIDRLDLALSTGEMKQIERVLHDIIGSSGNIRLEPLHSLAIAFQEKVLNSSKEEADSRLHLLKKEVLSLVHKDH